MAGEDGKVPVPEGYMRLISSEGHEFLIERQYAELSSVLKMMMSVDFLESQTCEVRFPETEAAVLEKTIQYLYNAQRDKHLRRTAKDKDHRTSFEQFDIPSEMLVKLLLFTSLLDL